jgi:SAM-dependent MidA family methyltransferase
MATGNPALIDFIRAEIQDRGAQSFAWFMQQALYHPEYGYYSSGRCAIGRRGDYFTNVSVGPLFGQLMAAQFAELWEHLGGMDKFSIVEQGTHDGQFAHDVLDSIRKRAPEFFAALRYQIVESFPFWRDRQRQTLQSFRDKVEWRDAIGPFVGVHFSNELLDAMPVDLPGKLVGVDGDEFVFVQAAPISPVPCSLGEGGKVPKTDGPCNQAALDWVDSVSLNLVRGYVLIIDYGHMHHELPATIQVRAQHRHLDSPFEQIGYADITMHVDWSSIVERAKQNGLRVAGFTDQHHFLTGIVSQWPDLAANVDPKSKRALQTLLHPEMLGRSFQVLALAKNVEAAARLASFKFARDL